MNQSSDEEEALLEKLVRLKKEHELLYVIYEELDDLIKMGYDGPFMGKEISGVISSVIEYKKWKSMHQLEKQHSTIIDPYDNNLGD